MPLMCGFKKMFQEYKSKEHYFDKLSPVAVGYFISKNECNRDKQNKDFTLEESDACYSRYCALLQCISTCRTCNKKLNDFEHCVELNSIIL